MSGTRKLEKFELDRAAAFESGTRKLEKFELPNPLCIPTPIAEMTPAMLAAARPSLPSAPPLDEASVVVAAEPEAQPVPSPPPARAARAVDRDTSVEQLRTRMARKFTTLADEVTESFDEFRIGAGAWTVELTAPDGMSTAGGKRVLQHLRMRPTRQGYAVLVGGVVNPVDKTVELRDYPHMQTIYKARFGQPLDITPAEWEQLLRKAEVVFRAEGFQTTRAPAPRDLARVAREAGPMGWWNRKLAMAALGFVGFLAAIVVWRVIVVLMR